MRTTVLKMYAKRWMMVCCLVLAAVSANGQIIYDRAVSSDVIIRDLQTLMDKFCRYVETIGTSKTVNSAKISKLRTDSVPKLFYEYDSCFMYTTYAEKGRMKERKEMKRYFRNLETQAQNKFNTITYDLDFELICSGDGFQWKEDTSKKYRNGAKCYSAEILVMQRYIREGGSISGDGASRKIEEDLKTMKVWKIMLDNRTIVGLGSVERIERIYTQGR